MLSQESQPANKRRQQALLCGERACSQATGISARFSKFAFVLFCYITNHLMSGLLGNSEFCFPRISMFPENIEILGKQNSLFPSEPVIITKAKQLTVRKRQPGWKIGQPGDVFFSRKLTGSVTMIHLLQSLSHHSLKSVLCQ